MPVHALPNDRPGGVTILNNRLRQTAHLRESADSAQLDHHPEGAID